MLQKIWFFIRTYRLFVIAVIGAVAALTFQLCSLETIATWILIATVVIELLPLLWGMIQKLREGTYGVDILAATAIITSVVLGEYWAGIVIILMLTGGESLEDYAEHRARRELDALLSRAPRMAHLLKNHKTLIDVAVSTVKAGDTLVINPGETVPVDAVIVEGVASMDESSLTGESLPQVKQAGDAILSGSINQDGALTVTALRSAHDSQYEQIIKLVRAAQNSKAPFVRMADRYAIPFTILSFGIAGTVWLISGDAMRFLQVLVVATPCPLILAAPIAIISGMSRSARAGIIIKNGSALENYATAETFAFDKTGTLTKGELSVDAVVAFDGFTQAEVIALAAAVEKRSNHVLGTAIIDRATRDKLKVATTKNTREIAGRGLRGTVNGKQVLVGHLAFMNESNVAIPANFSKKDVRSTAAFIGVGGKLAGYITFVDDIRPETKQTIERLKRLGMRTIMMITGDNKGTATTVGAKIGITDIEAEALPGDKIRAIERIEHRPVAFVGDGVNDAPVLTASDIGIALGARGSTAASESADIVIMQNDLEKVAEGREIARRTFAIARQSIFIGIALSVILMAIFATGKFKPIYGALAQEVVDVVVIVNALRAHSAGRRKS